jgi:hypothetical protein
MPQKDDKYGYVEYDFTCLRSLLSVVLTGHNSYSTPISPF